MPKTGPSWLACLFHFSQFIKVFVTHTAMADAGQRRRGRGTDDVRGPGRLPHGQKKRGDSRAGTDAAHILSWEVGRAALGPRGRPTTLETKRSYAETINSDGNMRIKSVDGNRKTDRDVDKVIIDSVLSGEPLRTKAAALRAYRQYKFAAAHADHRQVGQIAARLGELTLRSGGPGRPTKIKNL